MNGEASDVANISQSLEALTAALGNNDNDTEGNDAKHVTSSESPCDPQSDIMGCGTSKKHGMTDSDSNQYFFEKSTDSTHTVLHVSSESTRAKDWPTKDSDSSPEISCMRKRPKKRKGTSKSAGGTKTLSQKMGRSAIDLWSTRPPGPDSENCALLPNSNRLSQSLDLDISFVDDIEISSESPRSQKKMQGQGRSESQQLVFGKTDLWSSPRSKQKAFGDFEFSDPGSMVIHRRHFCDTQSDILNSGSENISKTDLNLNDSLITLTPSEVSKLERESFVSENPENSELKMDRDTASHNLSSSKVPLASLESLSDEIEEEEERSKGQTLGDDLESRSLSRSSAMNDLSIVPCDRNIVSDTFVAADSQKTMPLSSPVEEIEDKSSDPDLGGVDNIGNVISLSSPHQDSPRAKETSSSLNEKTNHVSQDSNLNQVEDLKNNLSTSYQDSPRTIEKSQQSESPDLNCEDLQNDLSSPHSNPTVSPLKDVPTNDSEIPSGCAESNKHCPANSDVSDDISSRSGSVEVSPRSGSDIMVSMHEAKDFTEDVAYNGGILFPISGSKIKSVAVVESSPSGTSNSQSQNGDRELGAEEIDTVPISEGDLVKKSSAPVDTEEKVNVKTAETAIEGNLFGSESPYSTNAAKTAELEMKGNISGRELQYPTNAAIFKEGEKSQWEGTTRVDQDGERLTAECAIGSREPALPLGGYSQAYFIVDGSASDNHEVIVERKHLELSTKKVLDLSISPATGIDENLVDSSDNVRDSIDAENCVQSSIDSENFAYNSVDSENLDHNSFDSKSVANNSVNTENCVHDSIDSENQQDCGIFQVVHAKKPTGSTKSQSDYATSAEKSEHVKGLVQSQMIHVKVDDLVDASQRLLGDTNMENLQSCEGVSFSQSVVIGSDGEPRILTLPKGRKERNLLLDTAESNQHQVGGQNISQFHDESHEINQYQCEGHEMNQFQAEGHEMSQIQGEGHDMNQFQGEGHELNQFQGEGHATETDTKNNIPGRECSTFQVNSNVDQDMLNLTESCKDDSTLNKLNIDNTGEFSQSNRSADKITGGNFLPESVLAEKSYNGVVGAKSENDNIKECEAVDTQNIPSSDLKDTSPSANPIRNDHSVLDDHKGMNKESSQLSTEKHEQPFLASASVKCTETINNKPDDTLGLDQRPCNETCTDTKNQPNSPNSCDISDVESSRKRSQEIAMHGQSVRETSTHSAHSTGTSISQPETVHNSEIPLDGEINTHSAHSTGTQNLSPEMVQDSDIPLGDETDSEHAFNMDSKREISQSNQSQADDTESQKPLGTDIETKDSLIVHNQPNSDGRALKQFASELGSEKPDIQNCHKGPVLDSVEHKTFEHCDIINGQQSTLCTDIIQNVAGSVGNASSEILAENSPIAHLHSKADEESAKSPSSRTGSEHYDTNEPHPSEPVAKSESTNRNGVVNENSPDADVPTSAKVGELEVLGARNEQSPIFTSDTNPSAMRDNSDCEITQTKDSVSNSETNPEVSKIGFECNNDIDSASSNLLDALSGTTSSIPEHSPVSTSLQNISDFSDDPSHIPEHSPESTSLQNISNSSDDQSGISEAVLPPSVLSSSSSESPDQKSRMVVLPQPWKDVPVVKAGSSPCSDGVSITVNMSSPASLQSDITQELLDIEEVLTVEISHWPDSVEADAREDLCANDAVAALDDKDDDDKEDDNEDDDLPSPWQGVKKRHPDPTQDALSGVPSSLDVNIEDLPPTDPQFSEFTETAQSASTSSSDHLQDCRGAITSSTPSEAGNKVNSQRESTLSQPQQQKGEGVTASHYEHCETHDAPDIGLRVSRTVCGATSESDLQHLTDIIQDDGKPLCELNEEKNVKNLHSPETDTNAQQDEAHQQQESSFEIPVHIGEVNVLSTEVCDTTENAAISLGSENDEAYYSHPADDDDLTSFHNANRTILGAVEGGEESLASPMSSPLKVKALLRAQLQRARKILREDEDAHAFSMNGTQDPRNNDEDNHLSVKGAKDQRNDDNDDDFSMNGTKDLRNDDQGNSPYRHIDALKESRAQPFPGDDLLDAINVSAGGEAMAQADSDLDYSSSSCVSSTQGSPLRMVTQTDPPVAKVLPVSKPRETHPREGDLMLIIEELTKERNLLQCGGDNETSKSPNPLNTNQDSAIENRPVQVLLSQSGSEQDLKIEEKSEVTVNSKELIDNDAGVTISNAEKESDDKPVKGIVKDTEELSAKEVSTSLRGDPITKDTEELSVKEVSTSMNIKDTKFTDAGAPGLRDSNLQQVLSNIPGSLKPSMKLSVNVHPTQSSSEPDVSSGSRIAPKAGSPPSSWVKQRMNVPMTTTDEEALRDTLRKHLEQRIVKLEKSLSDSAISSDCTDAESTTVSPRSSRLYDSTKLVFEKSGSPPPLDKQSSARFVEVYQSMNVPTEIDIKTQEIQKVDDCALNSDESDESILSTKQAFKDSGNVYDELDVVGEVPDAVKKRNPPAAAAKPASLFLKKRRKSLMEELLFHSGSEEDLSPSTPDVFSPCEDILSLSGHATWASLAKATNPDTIIKGKKKAPKSTAYDSGLSPTISEDGDDISSGSQHKDIQEILEDSGEIPEVDIFTGSTENINDSQGAHSVNAEESYVGKAVSNGALFVSSSTEQDHQNKSVEVEIESEELIKPSNGSDSDTESYTTAVVDRAKIMSTTTTTTATTTTTTTTGEEDPAHLTSRVTSNTRNQQNQQDSLLVEEPLNISGQAETGDNIPPNKDDAVKSNHSVVSRPCVLDIQPIVSSSDFGVHEEINGRDSVSSVGVVPPTLNVVIMHPIDQAVENYDDSVAIESMEGEGMTFAETSKARDRHKDGHSKLPELSRISKESSSADLEQYQGISSPSVEKEKSTITGNISSNVAIDQSEKLAQSLERPEQISVEVHGSAKGTSDPLVMSQMADLKQKLHAKGFTGPVLPLSVSQIKAQRSQATRKSPSPPTLTGVLSLSIPPSLHEITSLTTSQVPDEEFDEVSPRTTIDVVDNNETDENSISVSVTPDRFGNKMLTKVPSVSALEGMVQEPVEVDWGRSWSVDHLDEFDSLYGRAASTDSITYVFMSRSHSLDHVLDERSESPRPRFASESSRERRQSFPSEECSNDDLYRYGGCLSSSSSGERLTSEDGLLSSTGDRGTTSSLMSSEEPQSEEDQENTVLVEEVLARLHGGSRTGKDDEGAISEDDDTDELLATPRVFVDADSLDTSIGTSEVDVCPETQTPYSIDGASTKDKGHDIMSGLMQNSADVISSAKQPTAANVMPYDQQPTEGEEEIISCVPQTTTEDMVPNTEQPTAVMSSNVQQPTAADVMSGVKQPTATDVMSGVQQPTAADVMSGVKQPTATDVMSGVQQPTAADVMSSVKQPTATDVMPDVQQPTVTDVIPDVQQPTAADVMPGVQQPTAADVMSSVKQPTATDVMPDVQQPTVTDVIPDVQQPTVTDVMAGVQQPTAADVMPGVQQPTATDVMSGVQQPTTADVVSGVQQPTAADVMSGVQQPTAAEVMPGVQQPTTGDVMSGVQQPTAADVMSGVQQPTAAEVMSGVQQPSAADVMPGVQQPTTGDVMSGVQQPSAADVMPGVQQTTTADVVSGVQQPSTADVMPGVQQPSTADVVSGVQQPTAADVMSGVQQPTAADVVSGVQQPTAADVMSGVQQPSTADVMAGVQQPTAADVVSGVQQPTAADVMSGVQQPTAADVMSGVKQPTATYVMPDVQQPTAADVMPDIQQQTAADVMPDIQQPTAADVMSGVQQPTAAEVMSGVQQPSTADVVSGVQQPTAADVMPGVQQPNAADVFSGVQQPTVADVVSCVQQPTAADVMPGVQQPNAADVFSGVQQPTVADVVSCVQQPTAADVKPDVQQPTTANVMPGVQQLTVADVVSDVQQPTAAEMVSDVQQPKAADVMPGVQQPTVAVEMSGVHQPTTADVLSGVQQPTAADVVSGVHQPTAADVVSGVQQPTTADVMPGVQQPNAADVVSGVQQPTVADVVSGVQQPTAADVMPGVQQPTVAQVVSGVQPLTAAEVMPGVQQPTVAEVVSDVQQPTAADVMPGVQQPTVAVEMSGVHQPTTADVMPGVQQPTTANVMSGVQQPTTANVMSGVQQPTAADVMPGVQQPTVAVEMSGVHQPTTADVMSDVQQPTTANVMYGVQQPTVAEVMSGVQQPTVAEMVPGVQQPTAADVMPGVQQPTVAVEMSGVHQPTTADVMPGVQQPTTANVMSGVQQPTVAEVISGVQQPTAADVVSGVQQPIVADVMSGVQQPTAADVMPGVQQPAVPHEMPDVQQPTAADVMPDVQQPTAADVMPGVQQTTTADVMSGVQHPTVADVMPGVQQPTVAEVMFGIQQAKAADVFSGVQQPTETDVMCVVQQPTTADVMSGVQQPTAADVMPGVQQPTAADVMSGVQQQTTADVMSGVQQPTAADVMPGVQQPTVADVMPGVKQPTAADVMAGVQQPTAADVMPGVQQPTAADVMPGVQQSIAADLSSVQQPTAANVMSGVQQPTVAEVMSGVHQPTAADVFSGVQQPTAADVMPGVQQPTVADVMPGVKQPTVAEVMSGVQQPTTADVVSAVQQPTAADVMPGVQQPTEAEVVSGVQQPTTAEVMPGVQQPTAAEVMSGVQQPSTADVMSGVQQPTAAEVMSGVQQPSTADVMSGVQQPTTADAMSGVQQPSTADVMSDVQQPTAADVMSGVQQPTTADVVSGVQQPTEADVMSGVQQPTEADMKSGVQQPTAAEVMSGVHQPTAAEVMSDVQQPTASDVMSDVQQPTAAEVMSDVQQPTAADVMSGVQQPTAADVIPDVQQPTTAEVMSGVQQPTTADVMPGVQQPTVTDVMAGVQQPCTADVMPGVQQPTAAEVMSGVQQPSTADVMSGVQQPTTADVMSGVQQPTTADVVSGVQQPTEADVMSGVQQPTEADVMSGVQQPTAAEVMSDVHQRTAAEVMSDVQQPTAADVMSGVQQPTAADVMSDVQQPTAAEVMSDVQQPTTADVMPGVQQPTVADVVSGVQQPTVADLMSGVQQPTAADAMPGVQQPTAAETMPGVQKPTAADVMSGVQQPTVADVMSGVQQPTIADVMSGVQQPTAANVGSGVQQPTVADVVSGVQQPTVADVMSGVQQPTAADAMPGVQQPTAADVMSGVQQPTAADAMPGVQQPTAADVMSGVQQSTVADVMSGVQQPTVADVVSGVQQPTPADAMPGVQQPTAADVMSGVQQPTAADAMPGVQQPTAADVMSGVQQSTTADVMSGVQQPTVADVMSGVQQPTTADVISGVKQPTVADITECPTEYDVQLTRPAQESTGVIEEYTESDVQQGRTTEDSTDVTEYSTEYDIQANIPTEESTGVTESDVHPTRHTEESTGLTEYSIAYDVHPTVPKEESTGVTEYSTESDVQQARPTEELLQPTAAEVMSGVQQPSTADVMSGVQQPTTADVMSGVQQPTTADVVSGVQQPTEADVMSGVQQPTEVDVMSGVQQPTEAEVMSDVQQPTAADVMSCVQQPTAADVMSDVQQPTAAEVMSGVQQPTTADVMPGVQQPTVTDVMSGVQQPSTADVMPGVQQPTVADVVSGVQQPTVADLMSGVQQPTAADAMPGVQQPTAAETMPGVQKPTAADVMSGVQQRTVADVMSCVQQPTIADVMSGVQQPTAANVGFGVQQPTVADVVSGVQQPTVADVMAGVQQPTAADAMPGVQQPTAADVMSGVQQPTAADAMPGVQQPTAADVMSGVQQSTTADVMSGVQQPTVADVVSGVQQPTPADAMPGVQQPTAADVMSGVQQPTAADAMPGVQQPTAADVMSGVQQSTTADVMSGVQQPTVADVMSGVQQPTTADVISGVKQPTVADITECPTEYDVQLTRPAQESTGVIEEYTESDVQQGRPTEESTDVTEYSTEYDIQANIPTEESTGVTESDVHPTRHTEESTGLTEYSIAYDVHPTVPKEESTGVTEYSTESDVQQARPTEESTGVTEYSTESDMQSTRPTEKSTDVAEYSSESDVQPTRPTEKSTDVTEHSTESDVQPTRPTETSTDVTEYSTESDIQPTRPTEESTGVTEYSTESDVQLTRPTEKSTGVTEYSTVSDVQQVRPTEESTGVTEYSTESDVQPTGPKEESIGVTEYSTESDVQPTGSTEESTSVTKYSTESDVQPTGSTEQSTSVTKYSAESDVQPTRPTEKSTGVTEYSTESDVQPTRSTEELADLQAKPATNQHHNAQELDAWKASPLTKSTGLQGTACGVEDSENSSKSADAGTQTQTLELSTQTSTSLSELNGTCEIKDHADLLASKDQMQKASPRSSRPTEISTQTEQSLMSVTSQSNEYEDDLFAGKDQIQKASLLRCRPTEISTQTEQSLMSVTSQSNEYEDDLFAGKDQIQKASLLRCRSTEISTQTEDSSMPVTSQSDKLKDDTNLSSGISLYEDDPSSKAVSSKIHDDLETSTGHHAKASDSLNTLGTLTSGRRTSQELRADTEASSRPSSDLDSENDLALSSQIQLISQGVGTDRTQGLEFSTQTGSSLSDIRSSGAQTQTDTPPASSPREYKEMEIQTSAWNLTSSAQTSTQTESTITVTEAPLPMAANVSSQTGSSLWDLSSLDVDERCSETTQVPGTDTRGQMNRNMVADSPYSSAGDLKEKGRLPKLQEDYFDLPPPGVMMSTPDLDSLRREHQRMMELLNRPRQQRSPWKTRKGFVHSLPTSTRSLPGTSAGHEHGPFNPCSQERSISDTRQSYVTPDEEYEPETTSNSYATASASSLPDLPPDGEKTPVVSRTSSVKSLISASTETVTDPDDILSMAEYEGKEHICLPEDHSEIGSGATQDESFATMMAPDYHIDTCTVKEPLKSQGEFVPETSTEIPSLSEEPQRFPRESVSEKSTEIHYDPSPSEEPLSSQRESVLETPTEIPSTSEEPQRSPRESIQEASSKSHSDPSIPNVTCRADDNSFEKDLNDEHDLSNPIMPQGSHQGVGCITESAVLYGISPEASSDLSRATRRVPQAQVGVSSEGHVQQVLPQKLDPEIQPSDTVSNIEALSPVKSNDLPAEVLVEDETAEDDFDIQELKLEELDTSDLLDTGTERELSDIRDAENLSNIQNVSDLSEIQNEDSLTTFPNNGYQNEETVEQDFDCDAWKEEESKNDGGEIGGTRTSTVSSGIQTEFLPDERRTSSRLSSHISTQYDSYNTDDSTQTDNFEGSVKSVDTRDESIETDDTQELSDELAKLRQEREQVIGLLAKDIVPSKFQIEMAEAQLNYIIGQTDTLLQAFDTPWEMEDVKTVFGKPEKFLSDIGHEYLAKYRNELEESKKRLEDRIGLLEKEKELRLTARQSRSRNKELNKWRRKAEVDAFKLERERENLNFQRTRSMSPRRRDSSDFVSPASSRDSSLNDESSSRLTSPKQMNKHLIGMRKKLLAVSKKEEEAAKLHYSHSPSKNSHLHSRSLGSSSSSNKLKGYQATNLDSYRFYNPYDYRPLADLGLSHMQETAVDESVSDRMSTTSSLTEESEELLEEYRRTRSQTRSEIAKARENLDKPARETHRNGIYSRGPASER